MMTRPTLPSTNTIALVVLALALGACVVSPIPQPPNVQPTLDSTDMFAVPCGTCDTSAVTFEAPPGAVDHPDGLEDMVIWTVNLDSDHEPQVFPVEPDGSFAASPEGYETNIFRMQARRGGVESRSDPVDLSITGDGEDVVELDHPLDDCFIIEPPLELELVNAELGDFTNIELRNDCDESLTFDRASLRVPSEAFEVSGAPTTLAAGETAFLRVELITLEAGPHEAVLLIDVGGPEVDRRPVTIIALERSD